VTSHLKNTYRKLQVRCAAAAVMRAIQMRMLGGE
jgi:DNA-binding NarL/FixJ family response regulator